MRGHRTVPHTADVALEAWAPTREGCLEEAVAALVTSVLDVSDAAPARRHPVHLDVASDREALALLLDEVIFLLDARDEAPVATHLELADGLHGWFDVVDARTAERVGSVPKAVALSGLAFEPDEQGWRCSVTVDV